MMIPRAWSYRGLLLLVLLAGGACVKSTATPNVNVAAMAGELERLRGLIGEMDGFQRKRALLVEEMAKLEANRKALAGRIGELGAEVTKLQTEIHSLSSSRASEETKLQNIRTSRASAERELGGVNADVTSSRAILARLESETVTLRAKLEDLSRQASEKERELARLPQEGQRKADAMIKDAEARREVFGQAAGRGIIASKNVLIGTYEFKSRTLEVSPREAMTLAFTFKPYASAAGGALGPDEWFLKVLVPGPPLQQIVLEPVGIDGDLRGGFEKKIHPADGPITWTWKVTAKEALRREPVNFQGALGYRAAGAPSAIYPNREPLDLEQVDVRAPATKAWYEWLKDYWGVLTGIAGYLAGFVQKGWRGWVRPQGSGQGTES